MNSNKRCRYKRAGGWSLGQEAALPWDTWGRRHRIQALFGGAPTWHFLVAPTWHFLNFLAAPIRHFFRCQVGAPLVLCVSRQPLGGRCRAEAVPSLEVVRLI